MRTTDSIGSMISSGDRRDRNLKTARVLIGIMVLLAVVAFVTVVVKH